MGMATVAYSSVWINGVCNESGREALSQECSLESLRRLFQRIPNVITDAETYRVVQREHFDLSKSRVALLSNEGAENLPDNVSLVSTAPHAMAHFTSAANATILIAAGGELIESFLVLGLINELIIDFEPGLTTASQGLFPHLSKSIKLEMVGMRKVGAATIQLHYKIN